MDNKNQKTVGYLMYLLKTDEGFLHENVSEDFFNEDKDGNERNYKFTDNPFEAYQFDGHYQSKAPKYLYLTASGDQEMETVRDACNFLGGKMVAVSVIVEASWTELEDVEIG